jgi:hypothetical protein
MDLYDLRQEFAESGIMMCFNGPFSHSIIEEIGTALRNHLAAENIAQAAVLDVFAVYIELAQNVRNYLSLRNITQGESGSSIITIARWGNGYTVSSGNIIQDEDTEPLCKRIDELNAMTPDERKRRYREQMRSDVKPPAVGAGLGLFEIAKRSSAALTYSVRKVDDRHGFFSLTAFI